MSIKNLPEHDIRVMSDGAGLMYVINYRCPEFRVDVAEHDPETAERVFRKKLRKARKSARKHSPVNHSPVRLCPAWSSGSRSTGDVYTGDAYRTEGKLAAHGAAQAADEASAKGDMSQTTSMDVHVHVGEQEDSDSHARQLHPGNEPADMGKYITELRETLSDIIDLISARRTGAAANHADGSEEKCSTDNNTDDVTDSDAGNGAGSCQDSHSTAERTERRTDSAAGNSAVNGTDDASCSNTDDHSAGRSIRNRAVRSAGSATRNKDVLKAYRAARWCAGDCTLCRYTDICAESFSNKTVPDRCSGIWHAGNRQEDGETGTRRTGDSIEDGEAGTRHIRESHEDDSTGFSRRGGDADRTAGKDSCAGESHPGDTAGFRRAGESHEDGSTGFSRRSGDADRTAGESFRGTASYGNHHFKGRKDGKGINMTDNNKDSNNSNNNNGSSSGTESYEPISDVASDNLTMTAYDKVCGDDGTESSKSSDHAYGASDGNEGEDYDDGPIAFINPDFSDMDDNSDDDGDDDSDGDIAYYEDDEDRARIEEYYEQSRFDREYDRCHLLTKEECTKLLRKTAGTRFQLMFALPLYAGVNTGRELEITLHKNYMEVIHIYGSKRMTEKVEMPGKLSKLIKKTADTPLGKHEADGKTVEHLITLKIGDPLELQNVLQSICPGHSLKDLMGTYFRGCEE